MKYHRLLLGLAMGVLSTGVMAQNVMRVVQPDVVKMKDRRIIQDEIMPWATVPVHKEARRRVSFPQFLSSSGVSSFAKIGETYYDWQTNAAAQPRVVDDAKGWSGVWTMAPTASGPSFPDRGTGYNHWTASGGWEAVPAARLETYKTGWPNLVRYEKGGKTYDRTYAHVGFTVMTRELPSGSWDSAFISTSGWAGGNYALWPVAAASSNYIHIVAAVDGGDVNGVAEYPNTYTRIRISDDAIVDTARALPGYDSTLYPPYMANTSSGVEQHSGLVDAYNIVVRDSIVAIVMGDVVRSIVLWKSTDEGQTFTRYMINEFPYDTSIAVDSILVGNTTDGSVDVTIDENGMVHVAWAWTRALLQKTQDGKLIYGGYYPGYGAIAYWNESMPQSSGPNDSNYVVLGGLYDRYGDGAIQIRDATLGMYGSTIASKVNITAVNGGDLIITYASPVDSIFSLEGPNYSDIWALVYSNGAWDSVPKNLTEDTVRECFFPYAPAYISGDTLRIMFQRDDIVGTGVQGDHSVVANDIVAVGVPVARLKDGTIKPEGNNYYGGGGGGTGIADVVNVTSSVYPNPVADVAWLTMSPEMQGRRHITVTNAVGQVVLQTTTFDHALTLDLSALPAGIYTVRITDGKHVSINRVMKQ